MDILDIADAVAAAIDNSPILTVDVRGIRLRSYGVMYDVLTTQGWLDEDQIRSVLEGLRPLGITVYHICRCESGVHRRTELALSRGDLPMDRPACDRGQQLPDSRRVLQAIAEGGPAISRNGIAIRIEAP